MVTIQSSDESSVRRQLLLSRVTNVCCLLVALAFALIGASAPPALPDTVRCNKIELVGPDSSTPVITLEAGVGGIGVIRFLDGKGGAPVTITGGAGFPGRISLTGAHAGIPPTETKDLEKEIALSVAMGVVGRSENRIVYQVGTDGSGDSKVDLYSKAGQLLFSTAKPK